MIKIGMMIGDRYEILEKIGTGGMSDVYRAKDHKLNRPVAVKVLKQEFSENDNFVSKFRVEAQAAAGLMHPNIVNVYDVGDENGIHYIVMELVDGITLKRYIEKKSRLSVKEAVSIAIQVAMGLEAAHNNHIIHRDIKPQNIIISKEGKVKVTDFGIAKAATSNTITSNVMGSVHYTSPEQARGGYSDAKSDVYSLGITLFEMLTGRLPFNGDTTVAIAIKHIQEDLPSPAEFSDEIPISVEKIVMKCCQKSPDRRYQSAAELITDLKRSLITPDEDFVNLVDPDEESATRVATEAEAKSINGMTDTEQMRLNADVMREYENQKRRDQDYSGRRDSDYDDDEELYGRRGYGDSERIEKLTIALAIIGAVLVGIIVIILVGRSMGILGGEESGGLQTEAISGESNTGDGIQIPNVTGLSYVEAITTLKDKNFKYEKVDDDTSALAKNTVVSQSPEANSYAESGSVVKITVSTGKGAEASNQASQSQTEDSASNASDVASTEASTSQIAVPNLVGLSIDEAIATLSEAGLAQGRVVDVNNDTYGVDVVTAQSKPVGTMVDPGTSIDIEKSIGPTSISYSYSGDIAAPTEGQNYTDGVFVHVSFVTADGTSLLDTTTASFPITGVVRTGLTSATGVITFTYTATSPATTDENGNVIEGRTEECTVTRAVTFTQEN
ncbi:Stk1 family PASTA domain-containing Ser/Thr kinase [Butyrivibrio sp. INlla16]|uniref:Stk1 family PASTA domain-containing Ser/Thr kinase n=1 Tax=Butyrivibrio sp. INlla16 TaxID=1520807 RepID=UPI0008899B97|nr:Stk1 family PASTA domain-containing Ser/Thr kinase [Butyrivibrio sp. INlla16]SDB22828.1 serine/threonine protein kinase [Butyrivibrio sp. INlla16]